VQREQPRWDHRAKDPVAPVIASNRSKTVVLPVVVSILIRSKSELVLIVAEIELSGAACPLAGNVVKIKGTLTGQSPNLTGALRKVQSLVFGP
jgi:hypothetical protein